MAALKNVIFLVADSLRSDAMGGGDHGLPYITANAARFEQARAAGCWTLPATASMFTGRLPHEHGATSQTRSVYQDETSLANRFKDLGYKTYMNTANPATTHIFGLDQGFDRVEKVWQRAPQRHRAVDTLFAMIAKARVRRNLFTKTEDFVMGRMVDDVEAGRAWMQSNAVFQFNETMDVLDAYNRQGYPVFAFVNIMECHFPYHIADTFQTWHDTPVARLEEMRSLFHFVNQTRLIDGIEHIRPQMLEVLRSRQRRAWELVAPLIDNFVQQVHENTGNTIIFCSDHGDMFGEHSWQYHFANVADAGSHVPLYFLPAENPHETVWEAPVSMRHLHGTVLRDMGVPSDSLDLLTEPERSITVSESFWYNRDGKTMQKFKFNQFAFLHGPHKYIRRNDEWMRTQYSTGITETEMEDLPKGSSPLEELELEADTRAYLTERFVEFDAYSKSVL